MGICGSSLKDGDDVVDFSNAENNKSPNNSVQRLFKYNSSSAGYTNYSLPNEVIDDWEKAFPLAIQETLDTLEEPILIIGNHYDIIIYMNDAAKKKLGDDCMGRSFTQLFSSTLQSVFFSSYNQSFFNSPSSNKGTNSEEHKGSDEYIIPVRCEIDGKESSIHLRMQATKLEGGFVALHLGESRSTIIKLLDQQRAFFHNEKNAQDHIKKYISDLQKILDDGVPDDIRSGLQSILNEMKHSLLQRVRATLIKKELRTYPPSSMGATASSLLSSSSTSNELIDLKSDSNERATTLNMG
jgi:hypothetical protein